MSNDRDQKKFFRSERPNFSGSGRGVVGPLHKQVTNIKSTHTDANSNKGLSPMTGRKDDTESKSSTSSLIKQQAAMTDVQNENVKPDRLNTKRGQVPSKRKVSSNNLKTNRLKLQNGDDDSSSDIPSPPKPIKRRAPVKGRPKINTIGGKLTEQARAAGNDSGSSLDESEGDMSDEELEVFGKQMNHLMEQLGTKIETRIRVRTQKLTNAFENILTVPSKIEEFEQEQQKEKQVIIQNVKAAFSGIQDKLQEIATIQATNVEKCSRLFDEGTAAHDSQRKAVAESKQQHNSAVINYLKGEEKIRLQFADEEKQCLEQSNREIRKLRTKLMLEGELQSSEALSKL